MIKLVPGKDEVKGPMLNEIIFITVLINIFGSAKCEIILHGILFTFSHLFLLVFTTFTLRIAP